MIYVALKPIPGHSFTQL